MRRHDSVRPRLRRIRAGVALRRIFRLRHVTRHEILAHLSLIVRISSSLAVAGDPDHRQASVLGVAGQVIVACGAAGHRHVLRHDAVDRDLAGVVVVRIVWQPFIYCGCDGAHPKADIADCLPDNGRRHAWRATVAGGLVMAERRARLRGRRACRLMWHGSAMLHSSGPLRRCGRGGPLLRCGCHLVRLGGLLLPLRSPPGGGRRLPRRAAWLGSCGGSAVGPPPRALRFFLRNDRAQSSESVILPGPVVASQRTAKPAASNYSYGTHAAYNSWIILEAAD